MPVPFGKTYNTPADLLETLKRRGLCVCDEAEALDTLRHVGYYRKQRSLLDCFREWVSKLVRKPRA